MNKFFRDILQERDEDNTYRYSWSKVQSFVAFCYFLVLYTKQTWGNNNIPDIPDGWIFLIGVSSAAYLVAKYTAKGNNFYPSSGPVYNPPHLSNTSQVGDSMIIPGPDGPSALSVKKDV